MKSGKTTGPWLLYAIVLGFAAGVIGLVWLVASRLDLAMSALWLVYVATVLVALLIALHFRAWGKEDIERARDRPR